MDPKIRRDIWNLILRMKGNRLIIMTTHVSGGGLQLPHPCCMYVSRASSCRVCLFLQSMEEADILGDSIAIMAHGDLRCVCMCVVCGVCVVCVHACVCVVCVWCVCVSVRVFLSHGVVFTVAPPHPPTHC